MNFFKRNSFGYTLFELMIAILISSSLLILCYTLYRGQYKKILLREQQFERQKECLDFFTKISPFIHIASNFKQKDTRTLVLDLFPCEENTPRRPLEIQVNGNKQNKATLLIISRHIQEFSWFYWDSDKNNWVKFENGKTYSNLRFIKVTLLDKNKQILDTFLFSCNLGHPRSDADVVE